MADYDIHEDHEPPSLVIQSKDPSVVTKVSEFARRSRCGFNDLSPDSQLIKVMDFKHSSLFPARASKTQIKVDLAQREQESLSTREANQPQESLHMGPHETITLRGTPKAITSKVSLPK